MKRIFNISIQSFFQSFQSYKYQKMTLYGGMAINSRNEKLGRVQLKNKNVLSNQCLNLLKRINNLSRFSEEKELLATPMMATGELANNLVSCYDRHLERSTKGPSQVIRLLCLAPGLPVFCLESGRHREGAEDGKADTAFLAL